MSLTSPNSNKARLAKVLQAAGDRSRMEILCSISEHPDICVSEISAKLGLGIAIVSHHLRALARAGLLSPQRDGKRVCYAFTDGKIVRDLMQLICKYK